jgi:putative transcriptional regulator
MEYIYYIPIMRAKGNLKFKLARIERDLSQEELANRVGVTRQTIGLIERGKYNPSISLCIRIAKALNRTLDQLFWEESNDE